MSEHIPFFDFGGKGEMLHLAHANGFPPGAYNRLIEELRKNNRVLGMKARPLWPNSDHASFKTWNTAADDLIRFLDKQKLSNIIGVGHSFGANATVMAATKRPELFSKLILIEPVVLPSWMYLATAFSPKWIVDRYHPVVKKTLERVDSWTSREVAFTQFRSKKVFEKMSDKALWDYVNSVTEKTADEKFVLSYSKWWEAQIYSTITNPWKDLGALDHPFLAFRGETSDTISTEVWDKWKKLNNKGKFVEMNGAGHLVPVEQPSEVAAVIFEFLKQD